MDIVLVTIPRKQTFFPKEIVPQVEWSPKCSNQQQLSDLVIMHEFTIKTYEE